MPVSTDTVSFMRQPFSHYILSVLPCPSWTHEESHHMFQQVPVTRAPCFEALSLTVSPLESRGWLTCKQPCQGKMLKSLVGERVLWSTTYTVIPGGLWASHSGINRSEEAFSLSSGVLTGLATGLTLARLAWVGGGSVEREGERGEKGGGCLLPSLVCRC